MPSFTGASAVFATRRHVNRSRKLCDGHDDTAHVAEVVDCSCNIYERSRQHARRRFALTRLLTDPSIEDPAAPVSLWDALTCSNLDKLRFKCGSRVYCDVHTG